MGGGNVQVIKSYDQWKDLLKTSAAQNKAVVVDFTATWCGPCRMIAPIFEKLSEEITNVIFAKVDVDELSDVAAECEVRAMPTFQIFKDGKKAGELVGASPPKLESLIRGVA